MRRTWALAAALAAAGPTAAEDLPVRLPDAASWTFDVERTRERTAPDGKVVTAKATSRTSVTWRRAGDGGRAVLRTTQAKLDGASAESSELAPLLDLPIELDVDETLAPQRIDNWPRVLEALDAVIATTVPDPKLVPAARSVYADLSPEQAARLLMRDWALVSLAQGSSLSIGQPVSYQEKLANPLGGGPIDAVGTFELESYDAAAGTAVVVWRQAFDPKSAAASIAASIEGLAARLTPEHAAEARKAMADMSIARDDHCRHEIDIPTGLALKAVCSTRIAVVGQGSTRTALDRWTMTQTRPQTPAKTK